MTAPNKGVKDGWEGAKAVLKNLQTELLTTKLDSQVRHEIGNMLAISQANIEAAYDGLVDSTPERLKHVQDALSDAYGLLHLNKPHFDS